MAYRRTTAPMTSIAPIIPNQVGQRVNSAARQGQRTFKYTLRARATATIAVANGTAIRNRGSVWSLFDFIGLNEAGVDKILLNGRMLRALSDMQGPSINDAFTRLTSPNIGATNLDETLTLYLASPLQAVPAETSYIEKDPQSVGLNIFAVFNNDGTRLITFGAGTTVTFTNVQITLEQVSDDQRQKAPLFLPFYREIVQPITVAVNNFAIPLKTTRRVRGLIIQQDTDVGEVNDILTAIAIRGDFRDLIGPQPELMRDAQAASLGEFGGMSNAIINAGYLGVNFAADGRLASVVNPALDTNFRLEVNAQPSAAAGATQSNIRIGMLELDEVPGLTVPADARPFQE